MGMGKLIKIVSSFNSFPMGWMSDALYYDPEAKEYVLRCKLMNYRKKKLIVSEERFTEFVPPAQRYVCDCNCNLCQVSSKCPDLDYLHVQI